MSDDHLPDDQELGAATLTGDEDVPAGDLESKSERRFGCSHCSKTYTTKKSLTLVSTAEEVATLTTQQNPTKRKASTSPNASPDEAHQDKRKVSAAQPVADHGAERVYDPLGGQAYVPPLIKKKAVSNWLQGQNRIDGSSAITAQAHTKTYTPMPSQATSTQLHLDSQQYDQFVDPSHVFDRTLPPPANTFASQRARNDAAPNHNQILSRPPPLQTYQTSRFHSTAFPQVSSVPDSENRAFSTSGNSGQLDYLFRQMQATQRQNEAHHFNMAMRYGARDGTTAPPPFGMSGPLNFSNGHQTTLSHAVLNTPFFQTVTPFDLNKKDSVLTLRIHSNTHDVNGQPIFSLLRIRRDQAFGPSLNAYCANRGKEYGVHWAFIYRYRAPTHQNPEQEMQITLTWDLTPNDVKDAKFPDANMRDLDTIYVMQAKSFSKGKTDRALDEGGAVQTPRAQVSYETVDITAGETTVFQSPHVSHQWYRAVEQDASRLDAAHSTMKTTMLKAQHEIFAKNKLIAKQNNIISQLTTLSAQLRQKMHLPPVSTAQALASHVVRQRPPLRQPAHRPSTPDPTAFMAKCEAARDQQEQAAPRREPLQFPSSADDNGAEYVAHAVHHGRIYDAADKVVAETDMEEMDEE
ncbi:hypothetical protein N0V95_008755 [Ascochyta clinopodiicola]|nr:hypothetical protein N0V95_008755 [Ascochyta clinopodiicola]